MEVPPNRYGLQRLQIGCALGVFSLTMLAAAGAAADSWTTAGSMARARAFHTVTLLPDGRVLVAGGWNDTEFLDSAELYDPTSNTWTAAAPMAVASAQNTATLLPSGRVLVVGGLGNFQVVDQHGLYDPSTDSWSSASVPGLRHRHTATLLANGKVLIAGGWGGTFLSYSVIYDSNTDTSADAAPMLHPRESHTATLLPDGRVLVTGGWAGAYIAAAELYDPVANTWSDAAPMAEARTQHTATLLPNGKVLVAGGTGNSGNLSSAELYDPAANSWSAAAPMPRQRYLHAAALLPNGNVLLAGGFHDGVDVPRTELFHPGTGEWSAAPPMAELRTWQAATPLSDGKVMVAGGYDWLGTAYLASAELYDPANCAPAPENGCSVAGKSSVLLKLGSNVSQRKLVWKWLKGTAQLAQSDFGDPTNNTGYALCVYDQSEGVSVLKMSAAIDPGGTCGTKPCWKSLTTRGWGYLDADGNPDDVVRMTLKGGDAGAPLAKVLGKGAGLPLPTPASGTAFFDQDPAVIVQLRMAHVPNGDPVPCWSSTFDGLSTKRNDGARFQARTP